MQKINSGSRRKNSANGIFKFDKAQLLVQDIENIIEREMLATPAMQATYESNITRIKKTKRKRPGLIRNYNTKKTRQVINNMEFDPDTNTWLGNDDILNVFSPPQPALITNKSRHDKERVVGIMSWDPVGQIWRGNEHISKKFPGGKKPALITPGKLGSSAYLQRDVQGMVFDPVSLRWIGNDNELDVFAQIDKLADTGVEVGDEFHLSPSLKRSFMESANRHKSSLSGWFADGGIDKKAHLYAIRHISIQRIVRDIKQLKQRRTAYADLDEGSADIPERDVPSSPNVVDSGNGNSADAAEGYDDLDIAGKTLPTKPRLHEASDEWDKELEEEVSPAQQPFSAKEKAELESWDRDFDVDVVDKLQNKTLSPVFSSSKVEVPQHGAIIDYGTVLKAKKQQQLQQQQEQQKQQQEASKPATVPTASVLSLSSSSAVVDDGDDADGLELSGSGLLLLKPVEQPDADALMEDGDPPFQTESPDTEYASSDESWDEEFPDGFLISPAINRHTHHTHHTHTPSLEDENDEAGLQIGHGDELVLRRVVHPSVEEEDDALNEDDFVVGLEIPEDFSLRLMRR